MNKQALARLLACVVTLTPCFIAADQATEIVIENGKKPFKFEAGDCTLTIGGKTKIEYYFDRNIALLNKNLPDEYTYFKNTLDLIFDFAYGKKTFDHNAVRAYTRIRHKGVWGRGAVYADSDASSSAPIKLDKSYFGAHKHTNGKPLLWINEAWLQFSINAIANASPERLHTVKLGWFPFELGRGIALGSIYGLNREGFGLNTYVEDKGAPGIQWHGDIVKDVLSYDLYYGVFENRSKSLGDTLNSVKEQLIGHKLSPWRGVSKNNEIFAGRIKWKPINNESHGSWEFEPYGFYHAASDQLVKIQNDSSVEFGSIGMSVEHAGKGGFEFGAEGAFNLGSQKVHAIDQNKIQVGVDSNGNLVEQFSHITVTSTSKSASLYTDSIQASKQIVTNDNTPLTQANGSPFTIPLQSKSGRILPEYVNKLRGFMVVTDIAQKFEDYNLTLAAAYGFASGDVNPHTSRTCKTFKGFIGVHEGYSGKRVPSIMFLDEMRGVLSIPGAIGADLNSVDNNELSFTNLHTFGLGAKWTPMVANKKMILNPNMLFFWRALAPNQFDQKAGTTTCDKASPFIGSEFNLKSNIELIKDLNLFGNFGLFIPGQMFTDVKGIPFKNAFASSNDTFFDMLYDETRDEEIDTDTLRQGFSLSNNVAYFINIGFTYAF